MKKRTVEVVVISDVHLGTFGCHAKELINYLKSIEPKILILNGDIIDGWQFNKKYFPSAHLQVIKEIFCLLTNGTKVFYITGNHDEMLRRYCDIKVGDFTLTDKLLIEINNKKTWIFHGDVFDSTTKGSAKFIAKLGGHGYDLLILINRFLNYLLKLVGKEKMSLSKKVKNSVKKAMKFITNFEQTVAELAIEKKYQTVICGHIHHQQQKTIFTTIGSVDYLNSGDWVENLTALEFSKGNWSIYQYNELDFVNAELQVTTSKKIPTLNVLKDEIDLFIKSSVLQSNII